MEEIEKRQNYFLRLFRGKIPLPMTYWVWFLFITFVLNLSVSFYQGSLGLNPTSTQAQILLVFSILVLCYIAFILIAVWRSATNHDGSRFWANVAKIVVVVNVIVILNEMYNTSKLYTDEDYAIRQDIERLSKSLPFKVNKDTLLTKASYGAKTIYYSYQFKNMDIDRTGTLISTASEYTTKISLCKNIELKPLINNNYSFEYKYYDKNDKLLMKITTNKVKCKEVLADENILKDILMEQKG